MKGDALVGWSQVGACILLQAVSSATIGSAFSILAVPIGEAFESSRMVLMLAMTFVSLGTGILSPFLGVVMDRHSLRNLMALGSVALVTGFFALSFATSMTHVLLIYGLLMAPANVLLGPLAASVLVSRWFVKKRGMALGAAATGIAIGGFLFPPMIQAIISAFDWREAFRLIGVASFLLTAPAIFLVVVNHPADRNLAPDAESAAPAAKPLAGAAQLISTATIIRDGTFWIIACVIGVIFFGTKGLVTNLAPLAMDLGAKPELAALLISSFSAASFAGKLVFAGLADRIDVRAVMSSCLVSFMAGMACFWQAGAGYWLMAVGSLFMGLASGGMLPLMGFLVARAFGQMNVGRVLGMMNFATMPLSLLTPPLFGLIFDRTGSYTYALLLFISLALAALFLAPRVRTHPKPTSDVGGVIAVGAKP